MKSSDCLKDPIQWKIDFDDCLTHAAFLFKSHSTDENTTSIIVNALRCVSMAAGVECRLQRVRQESESFKKFIIKQQAESFVDDIINDALNGN